MIWYCWTSNTCWVCSQDGGWNVHARRKYDGMISPCDTTPVKIEAPSRRRAISEYKKVSKFWRKT